LVAFCFHLVGLPRANYSRPHLNVLSGVVVHHVPFWLSGVLPSLSRRNATW
jgi:hypothetical protein